MNVYLWFSMNNELFTNTATGSVGMGLTFTTLNSFDFTSVPNYLMFWWQACTGQILGERKEYVNCQCLMTHNLALIQQQCLILPCNVISHSLLACLLAS